MADGSIRQLSHGEHNDQHPSFSPTGDIAFSSDRDTMFNLYVTRIEGQRSATRRLTRVLTGAFDPVWRAYGEGLLFSGFERGGFQVYEIEIAATDSSGEVWGDLSASAAEPWTL